MKKVCKTNIVKALNKSYSTGEAIPINEHWHCSIMVKKDGVITFTAVLGIDEHVVCRADAYCNLNTSKTDIVKYSTECLLDGYQRYVENAMIDVSGININSLVKQFEKEYDFLYEHYDNVAGYDEAMSYGDWLLKFRKDLVTEFIKARGDVLSSDREVAAFGFAVNELAA